MIMMNIAHRPDSLGYEKPKKLSKSFETMLRNRNKLQNLNRNGPSQTERPLQIDRPPLALFCSRQNRTPKGVLFGRKVYLKCTTFSEFFSKNDINPKSINCSDFFLDSFVNQLFFLYIANLILPAPKTTSKTILIKQIFKDIHFQL